MDEGSQWTVGADSSTVRAHQHAAGARYAPPKDIPEHKLTSLLAAPAEPSVESPAEPTGDTGGWVESQERAFNKLKALRAVATRTDKREYVFQGTIDVASIKVWLRHPAT